MKKDFSPLFKCFQFRNRNLFLILFLLTSLFNHCGCSKSNNETTEKTSLNKSNSHSDFPNDIYKENIIRMNKTVQAGKTEGNRVLNDQLEIDIFVQDYTIDKGGEVCAYYKNYYGKDADNVNNRLTISINLWSKKILSSEIDNIKLQDRFFHGGMTYNYYNGEYFEDIY